MKIKYQYFIYFIFTLVTFSGAIRKWIIPSGILSNVILGVLLITPLLSLTFVEKNPKNDTENYSLFTFYIAALCLFSINPLNQSIYHSLFGFLIHLVFFSIILIYFKNKDGFNATKFSYYVLICLIIEVVLGSIQSVSSGDSFINRYAVSEDSNVGAALVGDAIRVTGTFSYIAGYSAFQYIALFTSFYLIKKGIFKQYSYIFLGMVFYGALISGSRGAVGFVALTSLLFLVLEVKIFSNSKTIFNILSISIILLVANFITGDALHISSRFNKSFDNFMSRAEGSEEEGQKRIFLDLNDVLFTNFDYKLTGIGLGATYQGANALFGTSPLLNNVTYEGEQFRLVLEGGYILFFFRLIVLWYFLSKLEFSKLFKIYLFLIISLIIPIVYNVYGAIYLALGLILLNQAYLPEPEKPLDEFEEA